jgi:hypothetical protein
VRSLLSKLIKYLVFIYLTVQNGRFKGTIGNMLCTTCRPSAAGSVCPYPAMVVTSSPLLSRRWLTKEIVLLVVVLWVLLLHLYINK